MTKPAQTPWSQPMRFDEAARGGRRTLVADEATRARIARSLGLAGLDAFSGEIEPRPWQDGVELDGRWSASVVYTCGLSLEPFAAELSGEFRVRAVPAGSDFAVEPTGEEVDIELETEDPPDVVDEPVVDLAGYLVEHLALGVDPFPRKPGAVFAAPEGGDAPSPFAVLKSLKRD